MPHRRIARVYRVWNEGLDTRQRSILQTVWVVLPFFIIGVGAIGLLLYSLTNPLRITAPFVFSQAHYQPLEPASGEVCPGDILKWPVAFTIQRAPVMVISVRSIWDVGKNQTAQLPPGAFVAGSLQFTNYTETTSVSRTAEAAIPPLPAGQYQIRSAAQEFNSQAAAYSVPFVVKDGCPPLPERQP